MCVAFRGWLLSLSIIFSRSIPIVAGLVLHSLLRLNNIPLCVLPQFVHSFFSFHLLALVNSAAVNIREQVPGYLCSVLLGVYLGVGLLDHMVILFLVF